MTKVFSSDVEIGLRLLSILSYQIEKPVTMERLICYDYLVLHGHDIFPDLSSLHPRYPQSPNEILIKRELFKRSLQLLVSKELIGVRITSAGIFYQGTDLALVFLNRLQSNYFKQLTGQVAGVIEQCSGMTDKILEDSINRKLLSIDPDFRNESLFTNF